MPAKRWCCHTKPPHFSALTHYIIDLWNETVTVSCPGPSQPSPDKKNLNLRCMCQHVYHCSKSFTSFTSYSHCILDSSVESFMFLISHKGHGKHSGPWLQTLHEPDEHGACRHSAESGVLRTPGMPLVKVFRYPSVFHVYIQLYCRI